VGLYEDDGYGDDYARAEQDLPSEDYWDEQARLPIWRRGLLWWLEVGASNLALALVAAIVVFVVVRGLL
jgi:hypothetical protein